ncbi:unconventional prefoldin RPB5 interactor-like protein [Leguminivora glycinivorella]|uniref:unconventional prefoldin RPB5 interactor-like protein n=1 Tax=Leguminivora glycinivorella TaxID=1035111 RepID=UPI00200E41CE|nr:unconventional prefoldin RPB5 interactor-like protein [Leguminivora glycinivorella]
MNILSDIYYKSLAKNEENLRFWENYLHTLRTVDFSVYADKLKVPALVPVGSKVFFRGVLKHTNEVTVALGADYFVKCSLSQAEVLRQHRIKDAESKVEALRKEREYIQNQLQFGAENVLKNQGQELIEEFTEEEDLKWREKHRENMRQYKQRSKTEEPKQEVDDEELWNRLEELELREELEEEMVKLAIMNEKPINNLKRGHNNNVETDTEDVPKQVINNAKERHTRNVEVKNNKIIREKDNHKNDDKMDLLKQVIDRQNELKEKLTDLKNKETAASQTEKDILSRLDEMEQLEELEDEMDRLDGILQNEDVEEADEESEEEHSLKQPATKIKRSVSFADEDDSETLELTFTHTETEPDTTPYDKKKGIRKPSDIYAAFSNSFTETTSILKKSKYDRDLSPCGPRHEKRTKVVDFQEAEDNRKMNKTIVVNDVVEKVDENDNKYESGDKRPMSLFKKRRQQNLK